jgi:hypothetical protein
MTLCTADFSIHGLYREFRKSDLRISIKDYKRNKTSKSNLFTSLSQEMSGFGQGSSLQQRPAGDRMADRIWETKWRRTD